ncbi:TetR/AcrR family transcriptional regulator, partial [Selenomonadales bacterium OttesenSCG-928-I06]|nr:TetR/AcrR family transcriptional regulator [Selenomonadales bacterium OttesenSCG-928-I06]
MNTLTLTKQKKKTKTYLYLKQALIILLQKNKYGDITVKDLVEKAGISRTAFYAQFKSKQDLVDQLINDIHSDATNIATENNNMCFFSEKNFVSYYIRLYNYILQNSDIYKVMLNNNGLAAFRTRMTQEALNLWKSKSCMF